MSADWEQYKQLGSQASQAGNYLEARALWLGALDEAKEFRFDDPRLCETLENLAEVYWRQGKYEKAEPLVKQILQIYQSVLGPDHEDSGITANNLALICERQGKWVDATVLYHQALTILEHKLGSGNAEVIIIRENHERVRQINARHIQEKASKAQQGKWSNTGWWRAQKKR